MSNVIVTGAISGIGLSTSRLFLQRGWNVLMVDRKEDNKIMEALKQVYLDNVTFIKADVSLEKDVKSIYKIYKDNFGQITSLVNNAGVITHGLLHETDENKWDEIMNNDVKSIYFMSKYFIPEMIKQGGGTIVNTASISGLAGDFEMPVYNAAKGAVVNLTRAMALDYAKFNIRVNSVCPGATRTGMLNPDNIPKYAAANPLKRICEPEEIAKVIYFLASNESSYCNGVNLPVTGGLDVQTGQPE